MSQRTLADLYPVLKDQFDADPGVTSVEVYAGQTATGKAMIVVTREVFERERLKRDVALLNAPVGRSH